jgi:hypothetical protein
MNTGIALRERHSPEMHIRGRAHGLEVLQACRASRVSGAGEEDGTAATVRPRESNIGRICILEDSRWKQLPSECWLLTIIRMLRTEWSL